MRKMKAYWLEQGEELDVTAVALQKYQDVYQDFDIVMVGPQVSYRLEEIRTSTGLPAEEIPSFDYAIANCPNIMKLAKRLYSQKK